MKTNYCEWKWILVSEVLNNWKTTSNNNTNREGDLESEEDEPTQLRTDSQNAEEN